MYLLILLLANNLPTIADICSIVALRFVAAIFSKPSLLFQVTYSCFEFSVLRFPYVSKRNNGVAKYQNS